jgi:hypothetical protein
MKNRVLAFLVVILGSQSFAQGDAPGSVLAATGGRFVFGQVSPFAKHQYMLDTKTGRLWQLVLNSDNAPVLSPVFYSGVAGTTHLDAPDQATEIAEIVQNRSPKQIPEALKAPESRPSAAKPDALDELLKQTAPK